MTELEQRHISELHELAAAAGVPRFRTLRREELAAAINAALHAETAFADRTESAAVGEMASVGEMAPVGEKVFAIIRLDRGSRWTPSPKPDQVVVEKVVSSEEQAERDAERLNALAHSEQSGASYIWRAAPLEPNE